MSPALSPHCHRLLSHASGGKHAPGGSAAPPGDANNYAAFTALLCHRGPSRTGRTARSTLQSRARTIARVRQSGSDRQSGIGQKKRSPGRPRVRRIIESVRWGAVTDPGTHPFSHKEKTNSIIISRAATKFALTISKKLARVRRAFYAAHTHARKRSRPG